MPTQSLMNTRGPVAWPGLAARSHHGMVENSFSGSSAVILIVLGEHTGYLSPSPIKSEQTPLLRTDWGERTAQLDGKKSQVSSWNWSRWPTWLWPHLHSTGKLSGV